MPALETRQVPFYAHTGGHRKRADVIGHAAGLRSYVVRQTLMRLAFRLALLLAQKGQSRQHPRTLLVRVHLHIVADGIRGKQTDHGARPQPALSDDLLQHEPRVRIQIARGLAHDGIRQHLGELSGELPGVEERHPIDVSEQLPQRIVIEAMHPGRPRPSRREGRPFDPATIGARLRQTDLRGLQLLGRVLLASADMILVDLHNERRAGRRRREGLAYAD